MMAEVHGIKPGRPRPGCPCRLREPRNDHPGSFWADAALAVLRWHPYLGRPDGSFSPAYGRRGSASRLLVSPLIQAADTAWPELRH